MKKIRLTSYFLTILFFTLSGFKGFDRPANNEVIQLGSKREIFVDNYLIDKLVNTRIVMHSPIDEGVVLYFDKPWEGIFCTYSTVIKDGGIYRTYYRGLPMAGKDGTNMETTCIAESQDGMKWIKPKLGLYKITGTIENNVILANEAPASHNFSPFLDSNLSGCTFT